MSRRNDDTVLRRTLRRGKSKSALELLGISPHKKQNDSASKNSASKKRQTSDNRVVNIIDHKRRATDVIHESPTKQGGSPISSDQTGELVRADDVPSLKRYKENLLTTTDDINDGIGTVTVKTEPLTTEALATEALTTEALTTEALTTEALTTEALTTETMTTEALTTEVLTTETLTTETLTSETMTTEVVTTETVTTEPVTTEAVTTEAVTTEAETVTTEAEFAAARSIPVTVSEHYREVDPNEESDRQLAYEALASLASGQSADAIFQHSSDQIEPQCVEIANEVVIKDFEVASLVEVSDKVESDFVSIFPSPPIEVIAHGNKQPGKSDKERMQTVKQQFYSVGQEVVASQELRNMMENLRPHDVVENHILAIPGSWPGERCKKMICKYCKIPIKDRHHFRQHIVQHADIVKYAPWKCPCCPYTGMVKAQITRHVNVHSEIKPYLCRECGKGFNFKQKLMQHTKYHLDIRDAVCCVCDAAFHEHKTLKTHLDKIHGVERVPKKDEEAAIRAKYRPQYEANRMLIRRGNHKTMTTKRIQYPPEDRMFNVLQISKETIEPAKLPIQIPSKKHVVSQQVTNMKNGESMDLVANDTAVNNDDSDIAADNDNTDEHDDIGEDNAAGDNNNESDNTGVLLVEVLENGMISITHPSPSQAKQNKNSSTATKTQYGTRKTIKYTEQFQKGMLPMDNRNTPVVPKPGESPQKTPARILADQKALKQAKEIEEKKISKIQISLLDYCKIHSTYGSSDVRYECIVCPQGTGELYRHKSYFIRHIELDHQEIRLWKCRQCDYQCRQRSVLKVHEKYHSEVKEHSCTMCSKSFHVKHKLQEHMKQHVAQIHVLESDDISDDLFYNFSDDDCLAGEVESEKSDTDKTDVERNGAEKTGAEKTDLGKNDDKETDVEEIDAFDEVEAENCFACEKCGKILATYEKLKTHQDKEHSESKFKCYITGCGKVFKTKSQLASHNRYHCYKFQCMACDKSFGSYSGFMAHKLMHDSTEDGFHCDICGKTLYTKGSMRRHVTTSHNNFRPFECEVCMKKFKSKKDLKNHMVVHDSNRPSYQCRLCTFSTIRRESLKIHMQRHNHIKPYQCTMCNKSYTQKNSLQAHMVNHTGLPEAKCHLCHKFFNTRYLLAQHKKSIHGFSMNNKFYGTNNFKCEVCSEVFQNENDLNQHVLSNHMINELNENETIVSIKNSDTSSERLVFFKQRQVEKVLEESTQDVTAMLTDDTDMSDVTDKRKDEKDANIHGQNDNEKDTSKHANENNSANIINLAVPLHTIDTAMD